MTGNIHSSIFLKVHKTEVLTSSKILLDIEILVIDNNGFVSTELSINSGNKTSNIFTNEKGRVRMDFVVDYDPKRRITIILRRVNSQVPETVFEILPKDFEDKFQKLEKAVNQKSTEIKNLNNKLIEQKHELKKQHDSEIKKQDSKISELEKKIDSQIIVNNKDREKLIKDNENKIDLINKKNNQIIKTLNQKLEPIKSDKIGLLKQIEDLHKLNTEEKNKLKDRISSLQSKNREQSKKLKPQIIEERLIEKPSERIERIANWLNSRFENRIYEIFLKSSSSQYTDDGSIELRENFIRYNTPIKNKTKHRRHKVKLSFDVVNKKILIERGNFYFSGNLSEIEKLHDEFFNGNRMYFNFSEYQESSHLSNIYFVDINFDSLNFDVLAKDKTDYTEKYFNKLILYFKGESI